MDADERDQVAEVGYWVAPRALQQGVAAPASGLLTRWVLTELGMARLEVFIEPENWRPPWLPSVVVTSTRACVARSRC